MKLFVFICVLGLISSIYSKPKREEQNAEEEVTRSYDIGGNAEAEAIRSNDARENAEEEVTRSYDIGGNAEEEAIRSNDAGESKRAFGWYDKSPFSYNSKYASVVNTISVYGDRMSVYLPLCIIWSFIETGVLKTFSSFVAIVNNSSML